MTCFRWGSCHSIGRARASNSGRWCCLGSATQWPSAACSNLFAVAHFWSSKLSRLQSCVGSRICLGKAREAFKAFDHSGLRGPIDVSAGQIGDDERFWVFITIAFEKNMLYFRWSYLIMYFMFGESTEVTRGSNSQIWWKPWASSDVWTSCCHLRTCSRLAPSYQNIGEGTISNAQTLSCSTWNSPLKTTHFWSP